MFPESRMVAVFQPHLYSRTRDLADEFGRALATADVVWVTDVFPAREAPIPGVTGALVADAARAHGAREVRYVAELEEVPAALAGSVRPGDLLLTLGAGSVGMVGPAVLGGIGASVHA
jgi:UDP-N-acetylmuramate--alanine ligase